MKNEKQTTEKKNLVMIGLTRHDRNLIELALEDHIERLRNRFQGPEYETTYIHPAVKYETLLKELNDIPF